MENMVYVVTMALRALRRARSPFIGALVSAVQRMSDRPEKRRVLLVFLDSVDLAFGGLWTVLQELEQRILSQDPTLGTMSLPRLPRPAEKSELREERKVVTVLVAALGSADRAEHRDPEETRAMLRRLHVPLRAELERFRRPVLGERHDQRQPQRHRDEVVPDRRSHAPRVGRLSHSAFVIPPSNRPP